MIYPVTLDFETASSCDLKKAGAWRYAEDLTTEILCCTFGWQGQKWTWIPGLELAPAIWRLIDDQNAIFVAHNAGFEKAIWRRICVPLLGWPDLPNERWHDTMAMCAMRVLPQDLERAMRVLGLEHEKDTEGSKITRALSKPNKRGYYERAPEVLARVVAYNRADIDSTVDLHQRLGWLPSNERQVWLLDQRINERGVGLDMAFVRAAKRVVAAASRPLELEFGTITGGLATTQTVKIAEWVRAQGVDIPDLKKETLARILGETEDGEEPEDDPGALRLDLPDDVRRALGIRQLIGSASIKKLDRMELCVCEDGRARGLIQYHGTGPGLWAGRLFQPQNFPRGTIQIGRAAPNPQTTVDAILTGDAEFIEATIGPAVEVVVSGLRHAIQAGRGRVLVAGDYAGIQARTVLALAGQHDKTALMAAGADIYLDMAESIFKRKLTKKENPEERQTGKNSVLGLGFQMGAPKFRLRYAKDQPMEFAENVVRVYRKEWAPGVPKVWYGLEGAAVRAVCDKKTTEAFGIEYKLEDGWLTARLPSGRKLWYYNPRPIKKTMPWDDQDVRLAWTYNAMKMGQWKTIDAFGGLLTENVVMGMQRDLMVTAGFKLEKNGFPIILNVHDEWVAEPKEADADLKAFDQIMVDVPDWARQMQIPISVETWAGDRYKK